MANYVQPGSPESNNLLGRYDPGAALMGCPFCSGVAHQIGSARYPWLCNSGGPTSGKSGHQFDFDPATGVAVLGPSAFGGGFVQIQDSFTGTLFG
jgi:hypothetical protein